MERFNAGNPNPNEVALLVSALLWGSKITESLKARGIERAAFEQACQQAVQSSPAAASGDLAACYLVMCKVAEDLKAQAADSGQHVSNIRRAVAEVACHFHGKLIHSAAESGALLRTTRSSKPLPYLYSDHFEHLALDFFPNGVPAAATCRKAYALLQQARAGKSLSQDDAELAQAFEAAVQELGSGEQRSRNRFVDPVLRQLKIPKAGGYVVITPLACPAISFEIAGWQQNASVAGLRRVPEVSLLYGGSNIQNVTSMSETRQVLVFDVPSIEVNARVIALSVIHKGWRVPLKEMTPDLAAHIEHVRKNRWLDDRDSHLAQKIEMADGAALRSAVRLAITDWRATAQAMQEALQ
ncbi:MAG: hypothetical protein N2690_07505, partial [Rhodocyclaceae bacterium]|nr:hypothetical protein [Rhodocyclaceae bacterium]